MSQPSAHIVIDRSVAGAVTPADLLVTPDGMRHWLASMPGGDAVGLPESLFGCPIANYLKAQGVDGPAVGPHTVRWEYDPELAEPQQDCPLFVLPAWCADLVNAIDHMGPMKPVTAAHCTALLHDITRQAA